MVVHAIQVNDIHADGMLTPGAHRCSNHACQIFVLLMLFTGHFGECVTMSGTFYELVTLGKKKPSKKAIITYSTMCPVEKYRKDLNAVISE